MLSIVLAASSRRPTGACLPVVLAHQARACCSACLLLSLHCPRRPPRTVPSKQQPVGDPGASIAQRSAQALDRSVPNRSASVANPIRLWAGVDQYVTRYARGHADLDYKDVDMQGAKLWENPEDSLDYLELAAQNLDSRAARIVSEALRQFGLRLSTPFHSPRFP